MGRVFGTEVRERRVWIRWGVRDGTEWKESQKHRIGSVRDGVFLVRVAYEEMMEVGVDAECLKRLVEKGLECQVWVSVDSDEEEDEYVGSAFVDLSDCMDKVRMMWRKGTTTPVPSISDSYPLIRKGSRDLRGSRIQLSITVEPISNPITTAKTLISPPKQHQTPLATIPLHITIERALHLPLMRDPFASTCPNPFMTDDEREVVPPNAFVTFEWTETSQKFQSPIITSNRCPVWNYESVVLIPRTESVLRKLKNEGNVEFRIWHSTGVKMAQTKTVKRHDGVVGDEDLVGTVRVDLGGLFGGLREVHGWYHVLDDRGVVRGQVMVRVWPKEGLGGVLREVSEKDKGWGTPGKAVFRSKSSDAGFRTKGGEGFRSKSSDAGSMRCGEEDGKKEVRDTWVWSGGVWEHRRVGDEVEEGGGTIGQGDGEELRRSLRKSLEELEEMQCRLKGDTPVVKGMVGEGDSGKDLGFEFESRRKDEEPPDERVVPRSVTELPLVDQQPPAEDWTTGLADIGVDSFAALRIAGDDGDNQSSESEDESEGMRTQDVSVAESFGSRDVSPSRHAEKEGNTIDLFDGVGVTPLLDTLKLGDVAGEDSEGLHLCNLVTHDQKPQNEENAQRTTHLRLESGSSGFGRVSPPLPVLVVDTERSGGVDVLEVEGVVQVETTTAAKSPSVIIDDGHPTAPPEADTSLADTDASERPVSRGEEEEEGDPDSLIRIRIGDEGDEEGGRRSFDEEGRSEDGDGEDYREETESDSDFEGFERSRGGITYKNRLRYEDNVKDMKDGGKKGEGEGPETSSDDLFGGVAYRRVRSRASAPALGSSSSYSKSSNHQQSASPPRSSSYLSSLRGRRPPARNTYGESGKPPLVPRVASLSP
ncbi:C2 domain-containing protein 3, partial [Rhizophlyctis rosea]